jgi:hypothetical protein
LRFGDGEGKMKLIEAISDLASLDDDHTIYAAEPWTPDSEVVLAEQPEGGRDLPEEAKRLGMEYFLEVFIARDFLEDWLVGLETEPTLEEKCQRIIEYAINDA